MEIFQPTITGSLNASGLVYLAGLTSASFNSVLTYDSASGQLFFTGSDAVGGAGAGFPFSGSAVITGSLLVSGSGGLTVEGGITGSLYGTSSWAINAFTASHAVNFAIDSTLILDQTITDFAQIASSIVGTPNLFTRQTGSYTAALCKYTVYRGTNARSGEFMTSWNGTNIVYTDTSTTDIGSTVDVSFLSSIVSNEIKINAQTLSSGWNIKMLATFM